MFSMLKARRPASIGALLLCVTAVVSLFPDSASAYLARGRLRVLAVDSGGVNPEVDRTLDAGVQNEDSASVTAPLNNSATGSYFVSIPRAELRGTAAVNGGNAPIGGYHSGTNGYIDLDLDDQLQCTVSAGSYPAGVFVNSTAIISINAHATGGDGVSPHPSADVQLRLALGSAVAGQGIYSQVIPANSPLIVADQVALEHQIVAPGTTYLADVITNVSVIGNLVVNVGTPTAEDGPSDAGADLRLYLTPITLSASGVTCVSDSGVFLAEPVQVPGLSVWGMVALVSSMVVGALATLRRRKTDPTVEISA